MCEECKKTKKVNKKRTVLIVLLCVILAIPLVIHPLATVIVYESIFSSRYETEEWLAFSHTEFENLRMERSDFRASDGIKLAGYKYFKEGADKKGVVIVSHGLGGGGHNVYMPFINCFASNGYYVFAYDAHGNGESEGDDAEGLPQGILDLDSAIKYTSAIEEYNGLPIVLFGHSWGAYSVGNVLNLHSDIKAAVMVAGFNESEDMLLYQSKNYVGALAELAIPSVAFYERLKFGRDVTEISAIDGMKNVETGIMIIQGGADLTVPRNCGYDKFLENFGESERFEFIFYSERGHDYLFYSEEAERYREELNADYAEYVEECGKGYSAEIKAAFMTENLDKSKCFEPDAELMTAIINMYDRYCCVLA